MLAGRIIFFLKNKDVATRFKIAAAVKKIVFGTLAVLLALLALEGLAWVWEALMLPSERPFSIPSPGQNKPLKQRIRRLQQKLHHGIPMVADESLGWKLPRGVEVKVLDGLTVRFNTMGLRGPEVLPRKPQEDRILTTGDSSVFGHGVAEKEVFSTVAARLLTRSWGRPVSAVNGATPGHASWQALRMLDKDGSKLQPTWVVIANIWSDIFRRHAFDAPQARLPRQRKRFGFMASYRVLGHYLNPWLRPLKVRWIGSRQDIATAPGGKGARVPLRPYIKNLRDMAKVTLDLGARPVFLILPAPMDFDELPPPELLQEYRHAMRMVAREFKAPLVDGPAYFRQKGAGIAWFFDQVHPSHKGHELLGQALADTLGPHKRPLGPSTSAPASGSR